MGDNEQIRIITEDGVHRWNLWRENNPNIETDISGADLSDRHLEGADFRGTDLSGCNLSGALLREANLDSADLIGSDLSKANFQKASLRDAYLNLATGISANFMDANLEGATIEEADLSSAVFVRANLCGANLRRTDKSGANFDQTKIDSNTAGIGDLSQQQMNTVVRNDGGHSPDVTVEKADGSESFGTPSVTLDDVDDSTLKADITQPQPDGAQTTRYSIPLVGRPEGRHVCFSSIGIGGGIVGVTAVFIPFSSNIAHKPGELAELLGWDGAEDLGESLGAIDQTLTAIGIELSALGLPEDGTAAFLDQLRTESWITFSASPFSSGPIPVDPSAVIRHPKRKGLFAILSSQGLVLLFVAATAFVSGPLGDIGKGYFSEITGVSNWEEYGRNLGKETEQIGKEVQLVIARLLEDPVPAMPDDNPLPRVMLRPETYKADEEE